jgi:glycosyltransferase involved in cell wall biosynthesis
VNAPLVTIVTATTGNPILSNCLQSVKNQTYANIQHLVMVDGPERATAAYAEIEESAVLTQTRKGYRCDVIDLPYSIGRDRWNGHRIYGSGTYIADGDYIMFLDDDNTLAPDHVQSCLDVISGGNDWSFSFRNIMDREQNFLCQDNCESLGKWASVLHPEDLFVDVNCYFLPRKLAVTISPVWFRKFREPGQLEIDRVISHFLRQIAPKYDSTYKYTVNYTVGNTENSVQKEFFEKGNANMLQRYGGKLPWIK